jgi:hypothetical protein
MEPVTPTLMLGMGIVASFVGLVILLVMIVLLGAGIGLGLFAGAVGAALVTLGVVSSSVALGFLTQKPATAVRALLLQGGVLAGIPAGAVTAWAAHSLINAIAAWQGWTPGGWEWKIPLLGAIGGAFAGAILALLLDFILRRTHAWLQARTHREASAQVS